MRRNVRIKLVSAVLALAFAALSQTLPQGVQRVTSVEGITEYSLPNGLHVLLFPDPSKPKITTNITYLVGSRHEGYGETGMAHLIEHMLFLRTRDGRDVKKDLTDHGAQWNGTTSFDRTNYFETVNASDQNLRWSLALEAERMVNMRMEKELLDTEMTVVRNEFEAGENNPIGVLQKRVLESAYSFHNYGKSTIGNRSDVEHVPIERLAVFYQKYYQPDNAILTIAGNFDESKALAWTTDTLGKIPRPQRKLEQTYTVEPTQDGERAVTLRRVGDTPVIMAIYHIPAAAHPDNAALEVLTDILGDSPSGRLYKALVDNKKASFIGMGNAPLHDPGFIMAGVLLRQEQSLDEARQILLKTIEGFVNEPPSKEEVEHAKTRLLKQIDLSLTDSGRIGITLTEYAASGDWRLLFYVRDQIKKVNPEDVVRVAKAYFKDSNRTLGEFIPTKNPDRSEIPAAPDIANVLKDYKGSETISQGESFTPTPSNIEGRVIRKKLPGGLKLVMLPKKTRGGVVVARVTLRFGDEKSLSGKAATAGMAGNTLMRGTKSKSRQQIQDESDRLKANIGVGGGATNANGSIQTIEANLAGALRLTAEILREPSFPESEFDQVRTQNITGIENGKSEPNVLASIEFGRHMNPWPRMDVRYVGTPDEQIEDLKKVTLDDVRKFHQQFYGASNGELVVVGQFDPAQVEKLATELFGDWKSPSHYERLTNNYRKIEPMNQKIETPDKTNALFLAGLNTKMTDEDPDYPAMVLANYILGGSGASRLFKRIRDKEGLSYGVGSGFGAPTKDDNATLSANAISNPQNAPKVEASFKDELARTVKDGFTEDEVAAAKKSWLDERLVSRSTDQSLMGTLGAREFWDRTMKWDEALEVKVAALTTQQISDAFRRHIDPSALTIVKAGDFKKAGSFQ
ncbi:MAG: insulinase family protein [Acidobacteriia bacterium]|nr:insulinase family protein [Terriglobia bacterium]